MWQSCKQAINVIWNLRFTLIVRAKARWLWERFVENWTNNENVYKIRVWCRWYAGFFVGCGCFSYMEIKIPGILETGSIVYLTVFINMWVDQYTNFKAIWRILIFLLTTTACIYVFLRYYLLLI